MLLPKLLKIVLSKAFMNEVTVTVTRRHSFFRTVPVLNNLPRPNGIIRGQNRLRYLIPQSDQCTSSPNTR